MKKIKILSAVLPLLIGITASLWIPLEIWSDMKEGIIAFLGFLAAALVQVMPVTANFLQSDRLNPNEAERLTASLTRQQHYWMGLLSATIATLVIVIAGVALEKPLSDVTWKAWRYDFKPSAIVSFFVAGSMSFVLLKMLGLFEGLMSLHRLRGELVINAAKREASEKAAKIERSINAPENITTPEYGQIITPQ